ncbi:hypothetical protein H6G65_18820, partial [Microcystis elabens FACHB-917]|nr:hypothetical protein [Microcystis elabens FACHB-917]
MLSSGTTTVGGTLRATNRGTTRGGLITLQGGTVALTGTGKVNTTTSSTGAGAAITVNTGSLDLADGSQLSTESTGSGTSGAITVAPSSAADLTVNGPGLIQSQATGGGTAGAISIGSSTTTATTADKWLQIKASGSGAMVDLLSSGTTTFQGDSSIEATGGSIKLGGANTTINSGSLQADGGTLTISGEDSTKLGTLSSLSANGGEIQVLSTGTTSSSGNLQASGGSLNLGGVNTTISGGSLTADQGGSITVSGSTKATISGGSFNATDGGSITVQGGDIAVGSDTGRTILIAGNGAVAADGSESAAKAPNLTLLDSSVSLNAGAGKSIEVFSGITLNPGRTTLRAVGADVTNVADAKAVILTTSGASGTITVGGRSSAPAAPVSASTIGDGVGITATNGTVNFNTTGNFALGVGSQLDGQSIKIKADRTDPITTPFLDKIAGSSSWLINQDVEINASGYIPSQDRSLSIQAAGIKVSNFSLNPAKAPWKMGSGTALDLRATGAHGLDLHNFNLSFSRTGTAGTADLFRATSSAGNTSIGSTSTVITDGDGLAVHSSGSTTVGGTLRATNSGTTSGGAISLEGANVTLTGTGKVNTTTSSTSSTGAGAAITVNTGSLDLAAGSQLSSQSEASGTSGAITVAPSSAAPLTVNGPGLIQSQASGSGAAGAIRIGSNSTTATSVNNGVQIKATGSGAMVDLFSSGTTTFQGDSSIEAAGGSIKLDGANTSISGGSLTADQGGSITVSGSTKAEISGGTLNATNNGSITVQGGDIAVGSDMGRTILIAGNGALAADGSESAIKAPNLTLLDSSVSLNAGAGKSIEVFSGTSTTPGITTLRNLTASAADPGRIAIGGIFIFDRDENFALVAKSKYTNLDGGTNLSAINISIGSLVQTINDSKFTGALTDERAFFVFRDSDKFKEAISQLITPGNTITFRTLRAFQSNDDYNGKIIIELPEHSPSIILNLVKNISATIVFDAFNDINFQNTKIDIKSNSDNKAGLFEITSDQGDVNFVNSQLKANGKNGTIKITTATDKKVTFSDESTLSTIIKESIDGDKAGNVIISTGKLYLCSSSRVTAETQGIGEGGLIQVDASTLNLYDGSNITTQAFNIGKAGKILLNAFNPRNLAITFTGSSTINASTSQQADGGGKGGDIKIGTETTPTLTVSGPGSITAETKGSGQGGVLDLKATTITLSNGAKATTETSGTGNAGDIALTANTISLDTNSRIDAKARQTLVDTKIEDSSGNAYIIAPNNGVTGDGGRISLLANTITLDKASTITAETQTNGIGRRVYVDTGYLNLYDSSNLTVQAFNIGKAGEILLN